MPQEEYNRKFLFSIALTASAILIPLIIMAAPWPIVIHVPHNIPPRPLNDAKQAERIYIGRVREITGVLNRLAIIEVLEAIKGKLGVEIKDRLGRIAGCDDVGNAFLVFESRDGRLISAYPVRRTVGGKEEPFNFPFLGQDHGRRYSGDDLIVLTKFFVRIQSPGRNLTDDDAKIIESFLSGEKSQWNWMIYRDAIGFLSERPRDSIAKDLLKRYRKAY